MPLPLAAADLGFFLAIGAAVLITVFRSLVDGGNETTLGDLFERMRARGRRSRKPAPSRKRHQPPQTLVNEVDALARRDADFALDRLQPRVQQAFLAFHKAVATGKLAAVRPFVSDGVFQRLQLAEAIAEAEGRREIVQNVTVKSVELAAVERDASLQTLHFRVDAHGTESVVPIEDRDELARNAARAEIGWSRPLRSLVDALAAGESGVGTASRFDRFGGGKPRIGSGRTGLFVEYWTFVRRIGAASRRRGTLEGDCPQCGCTLHIVDVARCEACGAWVNSSEHDWVLTQITHASQWRPTADDVSREAVAAAEAASLAADPGYSPVAIADVAAVMFWRLRTAERASDPGYAAPILMPNSPAVTTLERAIEGREAFTDINVGDFDVVKVASGVPRGDLRRDANPTFENDANMTREDTFDEVVVKVRWSGVPVVDAGQATERTQMKTARSAGSFTVSLAGSLTEPIRIESQPLPTGPDVRVFVHLLTLVRQTGTRTTKARGFAASSCGQCGAAIEPSRDGACRHCQTPLNDGAHGWVLWRVEPLTERWNEIAATLRSRAEKERPAGHALADADLRRETGFRDPAIDLAIVAKAILADRDLSLAERKAFASLCRRQGVADGEPLLTEAARDEALPIPRDGREAAAVLRDVVRGVLVDGALTRGESKLLARFAKSSSLTRADVQRAVALERREQRRRDRGR